MTAAAPGADNAPGLVPVDPGTHVDVIWRLAEDRDLAALGTVETTRAWIAGRLAAPGVDAGRDARLLCGPGGAAVGAVWVSSTSGVAGCTAELVVGPRGTVADATALLSFAERRGREMAAHDTADGSAAVELSCFVAEGERVVRDALDARGFGSPRQYHRMAVALDGELPEPAGAAGAVVRPLRDEADLRAFHQVKNLAFSAEEAGKEADGFDTWLRWWRADPGVDPEQCALLEVDGDCVGFANITDRMWDSRQAAYVRQIGVVPKARQRGLGSLLLLSVMRAAQGRKRAAMVLTVDADNSPARALYRRLGWLVESRFDDFHRTLDPAPGAGGPAASPDARQRPPGPSLDG